MNTTTYTVQCWTEKLVTPYRSVGSWEHLRTGHGARETLAIVTAARAAGKRVRVLDPDGVDVTNARVSL